MTPTDPYLNLLTRPVKLRATYSSTYWPVAEGEDDPDEHPVQWGGFCDPQNPWGTADTQTPVSDDNGEYPYVDQDNEPIQIELPLWEAIDFIVDFPGGVWDLHEGEHSQDYHTGVWTEVTLHVSDYDDDLLPLIFHLADHEQRRRDRRLRNQMRRFAA